MHARACVMVTRKKEAHSAYWVREFVVGRVKDVVDLPRGTQTHTRSYAVTFYLLFLFIIAKQCTRQTGKGYDVSDQEFVATEWSGNASGGGHFSCGVCLCLHLLCVLDALSGKGCNKFGQSAELV